ncbi:ArpU family transcriptional regulator, partial [Bacillus pseudomycoides]
MEQLSLLPTIDRETEKKVQKEVVKILKEYRALKARFENEVELQQEGISLFPEIRD